MNYDFEKDLKEGTNQELEIKAWLESVLHAEIKQCHNSDWDLQVLPSKKTIEIKFDDMAAATKNVAIEIECRGKPSGINVSKSDWWIQVVDGERLYIPTATLKSILPKGRTVVGGDIGSRTWMVLLPIDVFSKYCFKEEIFLKCLI